MAVSTVLKILLDIGVVDPGCGCGWRETSSIVKRSPPNALIWAAMPVRLFATGAVWARVGEGDGDRALLVDRRPGRVAMVSTNGAVIRLIRRQQT